MPGERCFPVLKHAMRADATGVLRRRISLLSHRERSVRAHTPWFKREDQSLASEAHSMAPLLQPSLSNGAAGVAVMHAALDNVSGERLPRDLAAWHLRDAIRTLEAVELEIDFFTGFTGVAWSVAACLRSGIQPDGLDKATVEAHLSRIDKVLEEWLEGASLEDVVAFESGVGALSVYAVERARFGYGKRLNNGVLTRILDWGIESWSAAISDADITGWLHLLARIASVKQMEERGQHWLSTLHTLAEILISRLELTPTMTSLPGVSTALSQASALSNLETSRGFHDRLCSYLNKRALLRSTRECMEAVINPDDQAFLAWLCAGIGNRLKQDDWIMEAARGYEAAIRQLSGRPITDQPTRQLSDNSIGFPYGQASTVIHWLPAVAQAAPDITWICSLRQSSPPVRRKS